MPSMSLAAFVTHLATAPMRIAESTHKALERAAIVVENEAKHELGTYQGAAGPFAAWAELADSTKEDRVNKGYTENDPGVRSGEMRDSIGHAVGHNEAVIGSNDKHMVYFELGTDKQPPRSALGAALFRKAKQVAHHIGQGYTAGLIGRDVFGGRMTIK